MANKEFEDYRDKKETEGQRQRETAKAQRDPDWNRKDHLDPARASRKADEDDPKDAEGQAERGHIDQVVTSKGYTQTR